MKPPIEMALDKCEWVAVDNAIPDPEGNIPHVTHRGILKILDLEMECFQLSDGQRIISEDGMKAFCKWMGMTDEA